MSFNTTLFKALKTASSVQIDLDKVTELTLRGRWGYLSTEGDREFKVKDDHITINDHGFATVQALDENGDDEPIEVQFLMHRPMTSNDVE